MRRVTWIVTSLLLAFALAKNEKKIVCYYSSWAVYRPGNGYFDPSNIDPNLCTHLIYAFIGIQEDGNVKILDPVSDTAEDGGKDGLNRFVQLREQNPNAKFLIGLGGWNEGSKKYSQVVGDAKTRKNLVDSAVTFIKKYKFDGLDFDWEYPNQRDGVESDKANFVLMLKELRERFDSENLLLTAALAAAQPSASLSYLLPQVAKYLHFINLMTYDFHGIWDKKTGMNAPLFSGFWEQGEEKQLNVYESVKYWIGKGIAANKIVMGVPFYGRSFTLANNTDHGIGAPANLPGVAGPYTLSPGTLGFNEFCEIQMQAKMEIYFQNHQQVPYAVKEDQWISYDDPWSIKKKANLINKLNLAGAMVWSIDTDDFTGKCGNKYPLLNILNHVLNNN